MQDTLFVTDGHLLRTHTSPVQIRVMERQKPPLRVIAPGAVYRHDYDITHSPMFHQVEGFMVDRHITFGDLKGVLTLALRRIFGAERPLRFRASFFPFTEPSAEVDIGCLQCGGEDPHCRVCKGSGWLEILGAGLIDPNVFASSATIPKQCRASPSAWASSASRCSSTRSTTSACSSRTTCVSCGSSSGESELLR